MKNQTKHFSLYITLGIIIISIVVTVISIQASYHYKSTKNRLIEEMKHDADYTGQLLQSNIVDLINSYSINEYDKLIQNIIQHEDTFAIIVEDYNMGKILGTESYFSGKIRSLDGSVIDYDPENLEQKNQLKSIFYSKKYKIKSSSGNAIGIITIFISNTSMNKELDQIINKSIIDFIVISTLLALCLFITIRYFILTQISNIINVISHCDSDGVPINLTKVYGSTEIFSLSNTINNMICAIRDTRTRLTQQHLQLTTSEKKIKTLSMATEQSHASVIICSPENIIEYTNPQFEKTSGYDKDEVLGLSIDFLFQHHEKDKDHVVSFNKALASGDNWTGEMNPLTKQGDNYCIRMTASPILLENGTIIHNIYVAEDITEQKQNEEILRTSQKMDAVGQLTGGIAHDFNNLLGIIMGNLELLKFTLSDRPKELKRIEQALNGTVRGAKLTRKLLNFSRTNHKDLEIICINSFIENLHELIAKSITASINVETHLAEDLWNVNIDPGDLEDAILNLSLNARDSMPSGGLLVIKTTNKVLDSSYVKQNPNSREGEFVMISVSDTGVGINEDVRENIFDPFFTTKELGKGTGLGLSMVYGFIKRSNGHIKIYSEEGKGTSFHIYLPRASAENIELSNTQDNELARGNETILIVDDEIALSELAVDYLNPLGYKTLVANSAKQALEILSSSHDIDLIFSDIIMPETDGFELSFSALKQQADIKILLASGFSSKRMTFENDKQKIYLGLCENILGKPYNQRELATAIRKTLDIKNDL